MGYLDSDSITVDAILTKHGRYKLSLGGGLDIQKFALADDGVDYNLWNPNHPSGSDYYDDAITSLPNLEAVPDDSVMMRYKLTTVDRNIIYWPKIDNLDKTLSVIDTSTTKTLAPNVKNFGPSKYIWHIDKPSIIRMMDPKPNTGVLVGGTDINFPTSTKIHKPIEFRGPSELKFRGAATDKDETCIITVTCMNTGAVGTINVTVKKTRD